MDFLKKHYEKVILLVLALVFIALFTYLLSVMGSNRKGINEDELRLPVFTTNYKKANQNDRAFDFDHLFGQGSLWGAASARAENANFADLMMIYPAAICGWCGKVVALSYFNNLPCPLCKNELPKRSTELADVAIQVGLDSDGDGIPDNDEIRLGLDPKNMADALADNDNDGFSNLYEYRKQTDINNPKSHSGLYELIYVSGLKREKIDVRMRKISTPDEDPGNWYAEITVGSGRSQFKYIGDIVTINEVPYKLDKIDKDVNLVDKGGTVQVAENNSIAYLVGPKDTLTLKVDSDVYAPSQKSVIKMLPPFAGLVLYVGSGEDFTLGDERVGQEKYTLKTIDGETTDIIIVDQPTGKEIGISGSPIIPKEFLSTSSIVSTANTGAAAAPTPQSNSGTKASDIVF